MAERLNLNVAGWLSQSSHKTKSLSAKNKKQTNRTAFRDIMSFATTLSHYCSTTSVKKQPMPHDFELNHFSVICGRGKDCFNWIGNRRFRVLVEMNLEKYSNTMTKSEKTSIVKEIVETIRSAGGSFVKFEKGEWYEVGDAAAREKVGALFRDCLHDQYRSSSKAKTARRRQVIKSKDKTLCKKASKCLDDDDNNTVATECSSDSASDDSCVGDDWEVSVCRRFSVMQEEEILDFDGEFIIGTDIFAVWSNTVLLLVFVTPSDTKCRLPTGETAWLVII